MNSLFEIVSQKKVLFITTKNIDYIRNTQELRLLNEYANRVDVISSPKKNYIFRILDVWKQIKKNSVQEFDVVFVGFAPQLVIPFKGKCFQNRELVIDFFISVYDTLVCDRKLLRKNGLMAKMCHKLDEKTIKRATHVIADTKAHGEYFAAEFGVDNEKIETLYLEADANIYSPREQKKPEELKDKFVVLYFGSILPLQGVDVVLDAVKQLKPSKDIYFEIIGPISDKYCKPIQDNVKYYDWLSQEELSEHIANADLCLAGHFNAGIEKANRTIPGKAYIYEMMKRPMILGNSKANNELFVEDERHFFSIMGDAGELSNRIEEIKKKLKV